MWEKAKSREIKKQKRQWILNWFQPGEEGMSSSFCCDRVTEIKGKEEEFQLMTSELLVHSWLVLLFLGWWQNAYYDKESIVEKLLAFGGHEETGENKVLGLNISFKGTPPVICFSSSSFCFLKSSQSPNSISDWWLSLKPMKPRVH